MEDRQNITLSRYQDVRCPRINGIPRAVARYFKVQVDQAGNALPGKNGLAELKIIYMDGKRHTSEAFILNEALKARRFIISWQPDGVITSDDNAVKYLVAPDYKGSSLPVVFRGVNWTAAECGRHIPPGRLLLHQSVCRKTSWPGYTSTYRWQNSFVSSSPYISFNRQYL